MIETEEYLRLWWQRLTIHDRDQILDTIEEKGFGKWTENLLLRVRTQQRLGMGPTFADLRALKKWAR